jgi:hypothetical protein
MVEHIHTEGYCQRWNILYTPCNQGARRCDGLCVGVTAAPVFHSHPQVVAEFDHVTDDPAVQREATTVVLE